MRRLHLLAAILVLLPCAASSRNQLAGCLVGSGGQFTLGAVPSGYTYRLQGDTANLYKYDRYLVRLTGAEAAPASSNQFGAFNVQKIEPLADTCTAPLPPQNPQAIRPATGKTSAQGVAVNTTTTYTAGIVTPGASTETGISQQPGEYKEFPRRDLIRPRERGLLEPPVWGQVGAAPQEGNLGAPAAERAEMYPGQTLGVSAMPSYAKPGASSQSSGTQKPPK
ncbi:MAG: hypothetical protein ACE14L_04065 [Terriglobales bacterium]